MKANIDYNKKIEGKYCEYIFKYSVKVKYLIFIVWIFIGYLSFRCTFCGNIYFTLYYMDHGSLRYTKNPFHLSKQQNVYLLRFNFKSLFIFNTLRQNGNVCAYKKVSKNTSSI